MMMQPFTESHRQKVLVTAYLQIVVVALMTLFTCVMAACILLSLGTPAESAPAVTCAGVITALNFLIVAVLIWSIRGTILDLRSNMAAVQHARLSHKRIRSRPSSSGGIPKIYLAEFEEIGKLSVSEEEYEQLQEGRAYRVVYAPRAGVLLEYGSL